MQCYSKRVTLTTQRSGECVITSCRCVCCFSLSGVWSCCRSFSSSCICHSLSWTVCFSISWSNAVSSRCTGSWGSLNTHTHTRSVITISAGLRHLLSLGHVFFLTYLSVHLPPLKHCFPSIYIFSSSTSTHPTHLLVLLSDLLIFIQPTNPSILTFSWCYVWGFSPSDCASSGCQT